MTTSHRRWTRIGTLVLLITVGLTVGMAPAVALNDPASIAIQDETEPTEIDEALENAEVPDAVAPGDSFTVDATAISDRADVTEVCWKFDEDDSCHDPVTSHSFEEAGSHTATLIVTDDDGERSSLTNLIVATTPPTADLVAPDAVEAGTEFQLDASGSTDDHEIESYEWDLNGDGTVDETTTDPEVTLTVEGTETHEVTVTAVDAAGQSDSTSVSVGVDEAESDSEASDSEARDEASDTEETADEGSAGDLLIGVAVIGLLATLATGTFVLSRSQH